MISGAPVADGPISYLKERYTWDLIGKGLLTLESTMEVLYTRFDWQKLDSPSRVLGRWGQCIGALGRENPIIVHIEAIDLDAGEPINLDPESDDEQH